MGTHVTRSFCDFKLGFTKRAARAFTLTELAVVLGVAGIVMGGIWGAAQIVINSSRVDRTVQDMDQIVENVRAMYNSKPFFTDAPSTDITAALVANNVIPSDMVNPAGGAIDAWSGAATVLDNTANNRTFRISLAGLPQDACIKVFSQIANIGTASGPVNYVTNCNAPFAIPVGGMNVAAVTAACAAVGACVSVGFDYVMH